MLFLLRHWKLVGIGLIVTGLLTYGLRNDHLRAGYKAQLNTIRIAFKDIGEPVKSDKDIAPAVKKLADARNKARQELSLERSANEIMAGSIKALEQETIAAAQASADHRRRIEQVTKERDRWIARARQAETRMERLTAEQELAECQDVLNELRQSGF